MDAGHVRQADGHPLGTLATGVGPGAGGGGAGGHRQDEQDQVRPGQAQHPAGHRQGAPARSVGRPQAQLHRDRQQGDPEHEVGHDHVGVELGVDDDRPEDGLAQDADEEATGQPAQVPAGGRAEERGDPGDRTGDDQDGDDHPVAEFDDGVEGEGRGEALVGAGRPVGAAQSGVGQPHRRPGGHVEDDRGQGDPAQEEEGPGTGREGGHRP